MVVAKGKILSKPKFIMCKKCARPTATMRSNCRKCEWCGSLETVRMDSEKLRYAKGGAL